jgi:plastocyanin
MQRAFAVVVGLALAFGGMDMARASDAPAARGPFTPPAVQMSSYDDHLDAIVTTDSSSRAQAKDLHINYAPGLATLKAKAFPKIYIVKGDAAPGQLIVLSAEPGEDDYSPVWDEVTVRWNEGSTPVLLTSDTQIDQLAKAGELTKTRPGMLLNSSVIAENVAPGTDVSPPTVFETFYDAHKDGMLATDVSTKPQAKAEGINDSPVLGSIDSQVLPEIYIVRGRMAKGQLMVLGSEPGEANYSPLWRETIVRWRQGVTPTVIKSDTQLDVLIAAGKATEHETTVVLNCPVTGVSATRANTLALASQGARVARKKVSIVDFAFSPKHITITKGTRVTWTNKGTVTHTTTSNTGAWDSGSLSPGDSFSHVFKKAGTFLYHCTIHANMKGKITVR